MTSRRGLCSSGRSDSPPAVDRYRDADDAASRRGVRDAWAAPPRQAVVLPMARSPEIRRWNRFLISRQAAWSTCYKPSRRAARSALYRTRCSTVDASRRGMRRSKDLSAERGRRRNAAARREHPSAPTRPCGRRAPNGSAGRVWDVCASVSGTTVAPASSPLTARRDGDHSGLTRESALALQPGLVLIRGRSAEEP